MNDLLKNTNKQTIKQRYKRLDNPSSLLGSVKLVMGRLATLESFSPKDLLLDLKNSVQLYAFQFQADNIYSFHRLYIVCTNVNELELHNEVASVSVRVISPN